SDALCPSLRKVNRDGGEARMLSGRSQDSEAVSQNAQAANGDDASRQDLARCVRLPALICCSHPPPPRRPSACISAPNSAAEPPAPHIPMPARLQVSDHLLQRLSDWGIQRVFGYAGDGINAILGAFQRGSGGLQFVQTPHEEVAALMACAH